MRYLVSEGDTWEAYEELLQKDKILHKSLCKIIKELLRDDPAKGIGKPEPLNPHSARNGRQKTIKKQAQGEDSSVGKLEGRNLGYKDEEEINWKISPIQT